MNIRELADRIFNWRKNPASVFYLAAPLALIGFGLLFLRGLLELWWHGDPWFLVIDAGGVALLIFALWPLRKPLARVLKG